MLIIEDDLTNAKVLALLRGHLENMHALSPAESVHALDIRGLKVPEISCWSAWEGPQLLGFGALKYLGNQEGEIKSMRTASEHLRKGVARALMQRILETARSRQYCRLYLETGSSAAFAPARNLYSAFRFRYCGPFGAYSEDPNSSFMTLELPNDK